MIDKHPETDVGVVRILFLLLRRLTHASPVLLWPPSAVQADPPDVQQVL